MIISAITENATASSSFLNVNELNISSFSSIGRKARETAIKTQRTVTYMYKEHYRERCFIVLDTNNIGDINVSIKDEIYPDLQHKKCITD